MSPWQRTLSWFRNEEFLNIEEYMIISRAVSYIAAIGHLMLWLTLPTLLGLKEANAARILTIVLYMAYPTLLRTILKPRPRLNRWSWFLFCTLSMSVYPWAMCDLNNWNMYWLVSLPFFISCQIVMLRSYDIVLSTFIGILFSMCYSGFGRYQYIGYAIVSITAIAGTFGVVYIRMVQQRLAESKMNMAAALEDLRRLDSAKDEFIKSAAHELRTPVTAGLALVEAIPINIDQRKQLVSLFKQIKSQVNALLDISEVTDGQICLNKSNVAITPFFLQIAESYVVLCTQRSIEFSATIQYDGMSGNFDADRVYSAITNLLNNACKFTPDHGSIRLVVSADLDGNLVFSIKDNGIGISESDISKIFKRYYKVAGQQSQEGLGIGLTLVKAIVDAHGGVINTISALDKGTTFIVSIPCGVVVKPGMRPTQLPSYLIRTRQLDVNSVMIGAQNVLIVEDNLDIRQHIRRWVGEMGYNALSFSRPSDALLFIQHSKISVFQCIIDISLPEMDGIELAKLLLVEYTADDTNFMFITGYSAYGIEQRIKFTNRFKVVEKPFDREQFISEFTRLANINLSNCNSSLVKSS